MKLQAGKLLPLALTAALLAGCASDDIQEIEAGYDEDAGAGPMAMAHVSHVATEWAETPDQQGLLTTARAEAAVVRTHADLAAQRATDSDWVKMHAIHVRHALAPQGVGPGKGYGLLKAVEGVKTHMTLAMEQDDVSDAIEFHGEQVVMSADSVLMRAQQLSALVDKIINAPRYTDLSAEAAQMVALSEQILMGEDLNEDGDIGWEENEPGLNQALKYVNYLRQKEAAYKED
ncbi:hypothetical protein [Oceanospirillum sanctuarii]|uniref:hypothetical protein n=1 Tax=Oceanospirillum sanctuarii TaxID=1434821 RepID=UPI000A3B6494|nr:hypothetical protein [Oceanospirillum sanctuarii]